jgi:chromosome segregation ATPase
MKKENLGQVKKISAVEDIVFSDENPNIIQNDITSLKLITRQRRMFVRNIHEIEKKIIRFKSFICDYDQSSKSALIFSKNLGEIQEALVELDIHLNSLKAMNKDEQKKVLCLKKEIKEVERIIAKREKEYKITSLERESLAKKTHIYMADKDQLSHLLEDIIRSIDHQESKVKESRLEVHRLEVACEELNELKETKNLEIYELMNILNTQENVKKELTTEYSNTKEENTLLDIKRIKFSNEIFNISEDIVSLKDEIGTKIAKIKAQQKSISALNDKVTISSEESERLDSTVLELREQLSTQANIISQKREVLTLRQADLDSTLGELSQVKTKKASTDNDLLKLIDRITFIETKINVNQELKEKVDNGITVLNSEMDKMNKRHVFLTNEFKFKVRAKDLKESQLSKLKVIAEDKEEENNTLIVQTQAIETQIREVEGNLKILEREDYQLSVTATNLDEKKVSLEEELYIFNNNKESIVRKKEITNEDIRKLKVDITAVETKRNISKLKYHKLEEDSKKACGRLEMVEEKFIKTKLRLKSLTDKNTYLDKSVADAKIQIVAKEREAIEFKNKINFLDNKVTNTDAIYTEQSNILSSIISENKVIEDILLKSKPIYDEKVFTISKNLNDIELASIRRTELKDEKINLEVSINSKTSQIKELTHNNFSLETQISGLADTICKKKVQVNDLTSTFINLQKQYKSSNNIVENKSSEDSEITSKLADLTSSIEAIYDSMEETDSKQSVLQESIETKENKVHSFSKKNDELKTRLCTLEEKLSVITDENTSLTTELENTEMINEDLSFKVKKLEEEYDNKICQKVYTQRLLVNKENENVDLEKNLMSVSKKLGFMEGSHIENDSVDKVKREVQADQHEVQMAAFVNDDVSSFAHSEDDVNFSAVTKFTTIEEIIEDYWCTDENAQIINSVEMLKNIETLVFTIQNICEDEADLKLKLIQMNKEIKAVDSNISMKLRFKSIKKFGKVVRLKVFVITKSDKEISYSINAASQS